MTKNEKDLLKSFRSLSEYEQKSLMDFADFLVSRGAKPETPATILSDSGTRSSASGRIFLASYIKSIRHLGRTSRPK